MRCAKKSSSPVPIGVGDVMIYHQGVAKDLTIGEKGLS